MRRKTRLNRARDAHHPSWRVYAHVPLPPFFLPLATASSTPLPVLIVSLPPLLAFPPIPSLLLRHPCSNARSRLWHVPRARCEFYSRVLHPIPSCAPSLHLSVRKSRLRLWRWPLPCPFYSSQQWRGRVRDEGALFQSFPVPLVGEPSPWVHIWR